VTIEQVDDESAGSLTVAEINTLIADATAGLIGASSVPAYINDLTLSINGGDAKTLDIAAGVAADSTDTLIMSSSSTFVKDLEVAWAEGTAQGGLGNGLTLTADVWYHIFMIAKTDGTVDFGADTDDAALNLLVSATGYTLFRRIGSVRTNEADTDITIFRQDGNRFSWAAPFLDISEVGVDSSAAQTFTVLGCPPDIKTWVTCNAMMPQASGTGGDELIIYSHGQATGVTVSSSVAPLAQLTGPGEQGAQATQLTVQTSGSAPAELLARSSDGVNVDLQLSIIYYEDFRGKE
jgi:hypothetical protein